MLSSSPKPQRKAMKRRSQKRFVSAQEEPGAGAIALLQPWFLPREISRAIVRLLPPDYVSRMKWMFDDYGCFHCHRKDVPYEGNGLCRRCRNSFRACMAKSMEKRLGLPQEYKCRKAQVRLTDSAVLASKLLSDLVAARRPKEFQQRIRSTGTFSR